MSRFRLVNTDLLRDLRVQRGWSQKDLAKKAGYTDRLVRKAELGGKLDVETIRNIAEALSTPHETITLDSLIHDNLSIAKRFVQGYDSLGRGQTCRVCLCSLGPLSRTNQCFRSAARERH